MNLKHVLPAAVMALATFAANAQTQAPGLWEHTVSVKSAEMDRAMAEMQNQMAAMSPEQRKQMEQAMASRGMSIGPQGTTIKLCITKEDAARAAEPRLPRDCARQDVKRSGNTIKFKFECTKPHPSSGEGEMTFSSDKAYTGKATTIAEVAGKPQQTSVDMSGKWLAAECGDIKPTATPNKGAYATPLRWQRLRLRHPRVPDDWRSRWLARFRSLSRWASGALRSLRCCR